MSMSLYLEQLTEKVYEKYPKDPDIWKLLQEVVAMHQDLEKCKKDIETIGKAISPMLMAEVICRMRKEK
jgi:hypothetical protein